MKDGYRYPYQVQLISFIDNYIYVPRDDDSVVRKCRSSLELLLISVRCGDSLEEFQEILHYYGIDLANRKDLIAAQKTEEEILSNLHI